MNDQNNYVSLRQQVFVFENCKIVPIRYSDRYKIMNWRNEQIYHLRQSELLTEELQDEYFTEIIANLFNQSFPNQLLFSFLENEVCVGYGGLVHINWIDKHAEVSFLMNTELEKSHFSKYWWNFLECVEQVAFNELKFHKIFTYAFDLRPNLYEILERKGFKREATLKDHCKIEEGYKDVIIHSKINKYLKLRTASLQDLEVTYSWAKNPIVRQFSISKSLISKEEHTKWFKSKLNEDNCLFYIAEIENEPIGSFRLDINEFGDGYISYLVDPKYHSNGYGGELLRFGIRIASEKSSIKCLLGDVLIENRASLKLFENLGFKKINSNKVLKTYKLVLNEN